MVNELAKRRESAVHVAEGKGFLVLSRKTGVGRPVQGARGTPEYLDIGGVHFVRSDGAHEIDTWTGGPIKRIDFKNHDLAHKLQRDPLNAVMAARGVDPKQIKGAWTMNNSVMAIVTAEGKLFSGYADASSEDLARHGFFPSRTTIYVPFSSWAYGLGYYVNPVTNKVRDDFPWRIYEGKISRRELNELEARMDRTHGHKWWKQDYDLGASFRGSQAGGEEHTPAVKPSLVQIMDIANHSEALRALHSRMDRHLIDVLSASALHGKPDAKWLTERVYALGLSKASTVKQMKNDIRRVLMRFHADKLKADSFPVDQRSELTQKQEGVTRALTSLIDYLHQMRDKH